MKKKMTVKASEPHTLESLYALLQERGQFGIPFELKENFGRRSIVFPAERKSVIEVTVWRKKITVAIDKENHVNDIGLVMLTDARASSLENAIAANQPLLSEIAGEVRRVAGEN